MKNKMFLLLFFFLISLFLVGLNVFHPLRKKPFLFDVKQLKKMLNCVIAVLLLCCIISVLCSFISLNTFEVHDIET